MPEIAQAATAAELERARELLREYTSWAFAMFPSGETAPTFMNLEAELAGLPGNYGPPDGRLLLATHDGQPAGCIALRRHDATSGEVKRLYVRPGFRGHRIGEQLVARLLEEARAIDYRRLVLDSHVDMKRAHALYRVVGFRDVPTPGEFPEHLKPHAIFMEMTL
jgi:GNAT superfamily N-acetyltransferase